MTTKKLSARGQKWLKGFHVVFGSVWLGSSVCITVYQFFINPSDGMELYGINSAVHFMDLYVLVPGANAVLLTALVYSIWTNWGWVKHKWITVKWIICLFNIIFGTYPLGPWQIGMTRISKEKGMAALLDPTYLHNQNMLYIFGTILTATLIIAVFLGTLKPWKKR